MYTDEQLREIDEIIAREVYGIKPEHECHKVGNREFHISAINVPLFTQSIEKAFTAAKDVGFFGYHSLRYDQYHDQWIVCLLEDGDVKRHAIKDHSIALAICLAVIEFKGIDVKQMFRT